MHSVVTALRGSASEERGFEIKKECPKGYTTVGYKPTFMSAVEKVSKMHAESSSQKSAKKEPETKN